MSNTRYIIVRQMSNENDVVSDMLYDMNSGHMPANIFIPEEELSGALAHARQKLGKEAVALKITAEVVEDSNV